jgi:O-antigen/teichoic acid export membrane protein
LSNRFDKIKDLSSIGIADIVGSSISALFWFYLATLIQPETYGEITYLLSIANIVATISLLGATQTLLVYSAKDVKIHATLYLLNLIIGVILSIIVAIILKDFSVGLIIIGYLIFAIAYSDVLGKKYFKMYTKYILIQKALMVSLSIGFYFIFGKEFIILGMAISFFIGVFTIIHGFKNTQINFKLFREKIGFISFNYANSISAGLYGNLDKIIIVPILGFTSLGNYSLGGQFLTLLMILPMIVGKYLVPLESSGTQNKKLKKIILLTSVIIGTLGFFIGPEISSVVFPKFLDAGSVIRIMSLSVIPSTVTMVNISTLLAKEKSKEVVIISVIKLIVMILVIIVLGPVYGIEGVAMGVVISSISSAIYSIFKLGKGSGIFS